MAENSQSFIYKDGKVQAVSPTVTIQVNSQADLAALTDLSPGSMAHTAGWKAAWQKKNDGTWESMI